MTQNAIINVTSTGNTVVISNSPGMLIQVQGLYLRANLLTALTIKSGTSGTAWTGPMVFPVGGDMQLDRVSPDLAYFTTGYGEDLVFTCTGLTAGVAGFITYNISA